jgi:hypothetical protein
MTIVVNTTVVTANSMIFFTFDTQAGTAPTNLSSMVSPNLANRTAGTSFSVNLPIAPATNPIFLQYWIVN